MKGCNMHLYRSLQRSLKLRCNKCSLLPDRLKLDWWRLRIGGGWWEVGEVLADGEGVMYLGVGITSYTGPSYIPRITPCLPFTCTEKQIQSIDDSPDTMVRNPPVTRLRTNWFFYESNVLFYLLYLFTFFFRRSFGAWGCLICSIL